VVVRNDHSTLGTVVNEAVGEQFPRSEASLRRDGQPVRVPARGRLAWIIHGPSGCPERQRYGGVASAAGEPCPVSGARAVSLRVAFPAACGARRSRQRARRLAHHGPVPSVRI
jgi:hypothetical protein